jgi:hypothetical protein
MFGKKSNVIRFSVNEDIDLNELPHFFSTDGAELSWGFVDYETKENSPSPCRKTYVNGKEIVAVKFRIDKRSVPGKVLKKEYEQALRKLVEQKSTVNEYGEVDTYIPSKDTKKELKSAIKNRLLKEVLAVPNYFDVYFNFNDGYGYFSSCSEKEFNLMSGCLDESIIISSFNDQLVEDDIHFFIESIYEKKHEEYDLVVDDNIKMTDINQVGKVSFVDAEEKEQVVSLLDKGYTFKEATLTFKSFDASFKLKSFYSIFAYEDEAMEVDVDEKQEEISQRFMALDALYDVIKKNIKLFIEE